jgi:hypothetical protein
MCNWYVGCVIYSVDSPTIRQFKLQYLLLLLGKVQLRHFCLVCLCGFNRYSEYKRLRAAIDQHEGGLDAFSRGYEKLGFTRR